MSATKAATTGFGVRVGGWPHCWILDVPKDARGDVVLTEEHGIDSIVERARVVRATWRLLADALQDELNARLKSVGLKRGAWRTGENRIERILGMEACLLLVGAAGKPPDAVKGVVTGWLGLRPPERQWLSRMAQDSAAWAEGVGVALAGNAKAA